jgi:hypothetical protein
VRSWAACAFEAIDWAFGGEVDYAMLVKLYGPAPEGQRRYSPAECIGARKERIPQPGKARQHVLRGGTTSTCVCTHAA